MSQAAWVLHLLQASSAKIQGLQRTPPLQCGNLQFRGG